MDITVRDYSIGHRDKKLPTNMGPILNGYGAMGFSNFCCLSPVNCLSTNERQSALRLGGGIFENMFYGNFFLKLKAISFTMLSLYLNFIT